MKMMLILLVFFAMAFGRGGQRVVGEDFGGGGRGGGGT